MRPSLLVPRAALPGAAVVLFACNALLGNEEGEYGGSSGTASGGATSSGEPSSSSSSGVPGGSSGVSTSSSGLNSSGSTPPCPATPSGADLCVVPGLNNVVQVAATDAGLYLVRAAPAARRLSYWNGSTEQDVADQCEAVVSSGDNVFALVGREFMRCRATGCASLDGDESQTLGVGVVFRELQSAAPGRALALLQDQAIVRTSLHVVPTGSSVIVEDGAFASNEAGVLHLASDQLQSWDYSFDLGSTVRLARAIASPVLAADLRYAYVGNCGQSGDICRVGLTVQSTDTAPLETVVAAPADDPGPIQNMFLAENQLFWSTATATYLVEVGRSSVPSQKLPLAGATSFTRSNEHVYFVASEGDEAGLVYRMQL